MPIAQGDARTHMAAAVGIIIDMDIKSAKSGKIQREGEVEGVEGVAEEEGEEVINLIPVNTISGDIINSAKRLRGQHRTAVI